MIGDDEVVRLTARHLGDHWAATCWMLFRSELSGRPVCLERTGFATEGGTWEVEPLVKRIIALLDSNGAIEFTDKLGKLHIDYHQMWRHSLPTRRHWVSGGNVCLQLTGNWKGEEKNTPPRQAADLRRGLHDLGFEIVELGLPMTIEDGVANLASCRFFIGIDSGYMHAAHSVGCPRFLIRNKMPWIDAVHGGRNWIGCSDANECLDLIRRKRLPFAGM